MKLKMCETCIIINLIILALMFTDSEQTTEIGKIVEMKQTVIDQQDGVIKLMRNLKFHQMENIPHEQIQNVLHDIFLKYDEAKQHIQSSEVTYLIKIFRRDNFKLLQSIDV